MYEGEETDKHILLNCPSTRDLRDKWMKNLTGREVIEVVDDRIKIKEAGQQVGKYLGEVRELRGKAIREGSEMSDHAPDEPSL